MHKSSPSSDASYDSPVIGSEETAREEPLVFFRGLDPEAAEAAPSGAQEVFLEESPVVLEAADVPVPGAEGEGEGEPASEMIGEEEREPEELETPEPEGYQLPMTVEELVLRVEAAVLTSDRALSAVRLGQLLGDIPARYIREAVADLNQVYESTGRSFRLEVVAGGFKMMTLPAFADVLQPVHRARAQAKLSPAALETLAIIAYRQPIIRAEIEAVRGVASGEVLRSLMDRHLVKVVGRADEIGRPMLYGTTKAFLEAFGLGSLKDLPSVPSLSQGGKP